MGDIFDNRLIQGDNLLALKVLEAEFAGKVKCVFIDPPYNYQAASSSRSNTAAPSAMSPISWWK